MQLAVAFRSSFSATYIFLMGGFVFYLCKNRKHFVNYIKLAVAYMGTFLIINYMMNAAFSTVSSSTLLLQQLKGGYLYQKVEFSETGTLLFNNPIGEKLFNSGLDRGQWVSEGYWKEYLEIALSNLDYTIAMAFKGIFNGLDISYDSIVINDLNQGKIVHMLVNYSMIFIALMKIISSILYKRIKNLNYFYIMIVNALPYCLGIVEVRFFMPMLVSLYAIACFKDNYLLEDSSREKKCVYLAIYFAFMCLCIFLHVDTWISRLI